MYHNIGEPPSVAKLRGLYVRPRAFALQMRLLKLCGYRGVSMSEAMPYLRGEKSGRIAAITFDDGYVDTLENALPILRKNNFSATCYVVSQRIGQYNDWDEAALRVKKPLMDNQQLHVWQDAGMEVGAHTRTHPHLPQCSDEMLQSEIVGCRDDLTSLMGKAITQFCYPYGSVDARTVEAVHRAGYTGATTTQRGRARSNEDPMQLLRILVSGSTMPHLFLLKLLTRYEDRRA
jgi:peptidoglycan/xylan/chitin deacetylase (PgdA/CDA1 family)